MSKLNFTCIRDIEEHAKLNNKPTTFEDYLKNLKTLQKHIELARKTENMETEYFFLYRYSELLAKGTSYDNQFTKKSYPEELDSAKKLLNRFVKLRELLELRYIDKGCNNKVIYAQAKYDVQEETEKNVIKEKNKLNGPNIVEKTFKTSLTSSEFYDLYKKKSETMLLLDTRPSRDYNESHIIGDNGCNIPEEIISTGLSAATLQEKLPPETKMIWTKRGNYENLILMDWSKNARSKLMCLKNIMTEWDPSTSYKCSPPLVLDGGYEDIIAKYPHITTNPKVTPPQDNSSVTFLNSLNVLSYPFDELPSEKVADPPKVIPPSKQTVSSLNLPTLLPSLTPKSSHVSASFDRNLKPELSNKTLSTSSSRTSSRDEDKPVSLYEDESIEDDSSVINQAIIEDAPKKGVIENLDELRKAKPKVNTRFHSLDMSCNGHAVDFSDSQVDIFDCSFSPISSTHTLDADSDSTDGDVNSGQLVPIRRSGNNSLHRTSSSPNINQLKDNDHITESNKQPHFTRENKPVSKHTPYILAYGERTHSTWGSTTEGLTGLKNFANNCYMNSIIQCLNNTEPLVEALRQLTKKSPSFNMRSRSKGRIAHEVMSAFNHMWSGSIRVYSITNLKMEMGNIKDIFQGSAHQDSNEFLIILLEHLHEDLNIPSEAIVDLSGAKDETGEKAWGEFKKKNCSVIQQLFYGQHKSTVSCTYCNYSSVTFEQFFNLFVPIPSTQGNVSLIDCIQHYMSGEKISGWKCPNCKTERNATKKFDISQLPRIFVIALKRFTQDDDSWLHKKENVVSYPLVNLDMSHFLVPNSEQRFYKYNLYAMSTHSGTLKSGHYRAICKNFQTNKWYMFDDQSVEPLPEYAVQDNSEVYILFYSAVKL